MAEFANPSAGKFGPPPENAQRERARATGIAKARKGAWPLALMLGIYALRYYLRANRGWGPAVAAFLGLAWLVAEHVLFRQPRDADGESDPYTPPTNITR